MSMSPHLVDLVLPQLRQLRQQFEVRGRSQTVELVLGDEAPADRQLDRGTLWRSTTLPWTARGCRPPREQERVSELIA